MKFKFDPAKKETKEYPAIIETNVIGLVYVLASWEYRIKTKTNDYPLHPKSISCKGKTTVYKTTLDKRKNLTTVLRHTKDELLHYFFMPVRPGSIVKGDIIKSGNTLYFRIAKVTDDWCDDSNYVYKLFKDNYKEINENRINKLIQYYES